MVLETADLLIRPFRDDDLDVFAAIVADSVTMKHWPQPLTREVAAKWVARQQELMEQPGYGRRILVLKATGEVIGDAGLLLLELIGRERNDLGYIIDHRFHGRGLATQAAAAMRDHAFENGVADLWANMAVDHPASRRVAEKVGMHLVATFVNPRNRDKETCLLGLDADGTAPTP